MLRELHISNLAVIADARVELHGGLNCFTGATGAGKSLVIGAIEVLLGLRSPNEMLRPGVEEGRVSGLFQIDDAQTLRRIEEIADSPVTEDGGEILLTRRLHSSGRTSAALNGRPITLGMLKRIGEALVDVHGQHDHQYLLKPSNQLDVLDRFGDLLPLRTRYQELHVQHTSARRRIEELTAGRTLRQQQSELYRFQAAEIDAARIDPAEFRELQARASVLTHLEKLRRDAGATYSALYECDGSILERLKMAVATLAELATLDAGLATVAGAVRDGTIQLEEAAYDLSRYLDRLDLDPGELAEVNDRLNTIHRILDKYGDSPETVLAYRDQIGRQLEELERATDEFSTLHDELAPLTERLMKTGRELGEARRAAARKLIPPVERQFAELGMEKARFTVSFSDPVEQAADASPAGLDQVEFIVQTNPGQLPQPLRKIASGGELSRIMLALKGILADNDRISVLVFDEIDSNVGGRLGSTIGNKLRTLASHHQVLCITHLPQIAGYADRHLTVRKRVVGEETITVVREVRDGERVEELAEMIGGTKVTATTRAQARELLDTAAGSPEQPEARSAAKPSSRGTVKR